jgi:Fur family peroxide stress response transcriptional regulator
MQHSISGRTVKTSRQRDLVLQIVRNSHRHPTADWVFEQARQQIPNISLGTVYRNLNLIREEGKIQELCFQNGVRRYDGDLRRHYHIRCTECGCVEDIPHIASLPPIVEIEKLTGYYIQDQRIDFLGVCPECRRLLVQRENPTDSFTE